MKQERAPVIDDQALNKHPLLVKLSELAAQLVGINMAAIHPGKNQWKQVRIGTATNTPLFCRLIQGSHEGAKRCKMCHILMTASSDNKDVVERKCHAGASALVTPLTHISDRSSALVSSCMFTSTTRRRAWDAAQACGTQLGLDLTQLRAAFSALPKINRKKLQLARSIMALAAEIMSEIKSRTVAEEALSRQSMSLDVPHQIRAALRHELKRDSVTMAKQQTLKPGKTGGNSALIKAVTSLVTHQPALDYSATTIAAAARITPNHFSTLFHREMGKSFSEFLTEQRITASKILLQDLSLNITEVANRAGYEDANYFARRFKRATGMTPRAWRNTLADSKPSE